MIAFLFVPCPGYYCTGGAQTTTPGPDENYGDHCPPAYYCPAGSANPLPCEPGSYNINMTLQASCTECEAGKYCTGM